jgi:uncharacterized protein (DUF362 family)
MKIEGATVAVIQCSEVEDLTADVERALDLIEMPMLAPGTVVAIKPNLGTTNSPDLGDTTDVRLVEAVINAFRKKFEDCSFVVIESDSQGTLAARAFDELGYTDLGRRLNVKLVNLSKDKRSRLHVRDGSALVLLTVPETLMFAGFFISVPKMKTHSNEKMTCALKNQFGCIPRKSKTEYHPFMSGVLADLNRIYRPDLVIVDGLVGMEGFGPSDGEPRKDGLIVCGRDPVAVDAVVARMMGFNPGRIPSIKSAAKHGVGEYRDVRIVGDSQKIRAYRFVPWHAYMLARITLRFQRYETYMLKLGDFMLKVRSLMVMTGISAVSSRLSIRDITKLFKEFVLRLEA